MAATAEVHQSLPGVTDVDPQYGYGAVCKLDAMPVGGLDRDRQRLYLHVYEWPKDGVIEVRGAAVKATRAWLLARPDATVKVAAHDDGGLRLTLPGDAPDPAVSVVAVQFESELRKH